MRFLLILPLLLIACQNEAADEAELTPAADPMAEDIIQTEDAAEMSPSERLNLNTSTEDDFRALGIGDKMAHEFDEYRPYTSVRQFRQEIGKYINNDPEQLAEYERMVFVPINLQGSDAETIAQLPGVSAAAAEQIADGMPYASEQAFLAAYQEASGASEVESARMYLALE